MKRILFFILLSFMVGCQTAPPLSRKECAYFPPALAYQDADASDWHIMIDGAMTRKSWAVRQLPLFEDWFDIEEKIPDEQKRLMFRERIIPFMSHHPGRRSLEVVIGNRLYRVGPSDKHGYIRNEVTWPAQEGNARGVIDPVEMRVVASLDDPYTVSCVRFIPPEGISIISDIDDTIRITQVQNTKKMIKNTFMEPFRPLPGMPEVMQAWKQKARMEFHYLTASTYWLYPPMIDFLKDYFPAGTLHFRAVQASGMKAVFGLFDTPSGYKSDAISRLIAVLPRRQFVLVGDSGERDPDEYAKVARRYPSQVRLILIHDTTCEKADAPRYQETFAGLPRSLWQIYNDPVEISNALDPIVASMPAP